MRNTKKNVACKSTVAFADTPTARNAVVNWYWAEQFSADLLVIVSQLDWRFLQYVGKMAENYVAEWGGNNHVTQHAVKAHNAVCTLSSFLIDHQSLISEFNSVSNEVIAQHHDYIKKESYRRFEQRASKKNGRKPVAKRASAKKSAA